jgi:hypothetical protein
LKENADRMSYGNITKKVFLSINQKEKEVWEDLANIGRIMFVISVRAHSRPNAGKDDDNKLHLSHTFILKYILFLPYSLSFFEARIPQYSNRNKRFSSMAFRSALVSTKSPI